MCRRTVRIPGILMIMCKINALLDPEGGTGGGDHPTLLIDL